MRIPKKQLTKTRILEYLPDYIDIGQRVSQIKASFPTAIHGIELRCPNIQPFLFSFGIGIDLGQNFIHRACHHPIFILFLCPRFIIRTFRIAHQRIVARTDVVDGLYHTGNFQVTLNTPGSTI